VLELPRVLEYRQDCFSGWDYFPRWKKGESVENNLKK
jgi:hypothetical protein